MEEKKLSQLSDEKLDAVTGGAYIQKTADGKYEVFSKGKSYGTFASEEEAKAQMSWVERTYEWVPEPKQLLQFPTGRRGL